MKAQKKKEEAKSSELSRLGVTTEKKTLQEVSVVPGVLKSEFGPACETVKGTLETVITSEYLENILKIMNENR